MLRIEEIVGAMDDEFRYTLEAFDDDRLAALLADKAALRRLRPVGVSTAEAQAMIVAIQDKRAKAKSEPPPAAAPPPRKPARPRPTRAAKPSLPPTTEAPPEEQPRTAAFAAPRTPLPLPPPPSATRLPPPASHGPAIRLAPPPNSGPAIALGPPVDQVPPDAPTAPESPSPLPEDEPMTLPPPTLIRALGRRDALVLGILCLGLILTLVLAGG